MKTAVLPPPPVGLEQLARSATRTSICSRSERKGWGGECAKHNSPLPPWGRGRGWGLSAYLADKLTAAFTYTSSAQAYVNGKKRTDAESTAEHPLPRRAKPAAGEGWGGGNPNRLIINIEASADVSRVCAKRNSPLPLWGRAGVGAAEKPRSDHAHSASTFTYTIVATLYVKLFLLLTLLAAPASTATPEFKPLESGGSYASTTYKNVRYGIYQADPAQVSLHWKDSDGSAYASLGTLKRRLEQNGAHVAFLMNAGIYSQDDTPAGLWIERGQTLVPLNRKNGKGNFHIQPNGVFYIERGKARIQTSAAYHIGGHYPDWALQSGPMLLLDGKINPRFVKDLSSPHKRNAVCTTADGRLYFILTEDYDPGSEWPSFHRYAEALQHLGCQQALYLDGTLSDWYLPGISGTFHWTHYVGIIAVTTPETP